MKIVHIINGLGNGGAEKNLIRLVTNDKKNIHEIITLSNNNFYLSFLKKKKIKYSEYRLNKKKIIHNIIKINKKIKQIKPDLLICWMYHSSFVGSIINLLNTNLKCIWNIRHSDFIFGKTKITTIILARIVLPLFQLLPRALIFNSNHSLKIHKKYLFLNKQKFVIHNGFDDKKKYASNPNKKINTTIKIGFIGRFSPQKNHEFFFRFLNQLKERNKKFKAYLIGNNINKNNILLKTLVNKYKLSKHIIFLKEKKDINLYYTFFDILVSTSFYGESFPNVIAEAMLNKTICIAPNIGENYKILNNKKLIYEKDNIEDLIKRFNYITNVKNRQRVEIQNNLYQRASKKFSISRMIKNYNYIFKLI